MHNEGIVHKIEAIGFSFPGTANDLFLFLRRELGHFIDNFPGIGTVRNAEAKGEVETLQQLRFKVMSFNHPKVRHFFRSHRKLDCSPDCLQL